LDEWEFNRRAGLTEADDDMAVCMKEEGIGPGGIMKWDVPLESVQDVKARPAAWRDEMFAVKAAG
jgi:hypothetical protein